MLIKLTPPASPAPTPTILFAIAFPDLPQNLPIPAAWTAQLARLAADDLEAPPALHALDRAAALPSLLGEVLFDLPRQRVACTFLDGAAEEWDMDARCAEMLARVIRDVEESGKAEERSREWQRALEAKRAREEEEREQEAERETEVRERQAEREKEYEREVQKAKGKAKEQSLNSPPPSVKGTRPKGRLNRSRSLLMALVAYVSLFSSTSYSSDMRHFYHFHLLLDRLTPSTVHSLLRLPLRRLQHCPPHLLLHPRRDYLFRPRLPLSAHLRVAPPSLRSPPWHAGTPWRLPAYPCHRQARHLPSPTISKRPPRLLRHRQLPLRSPSIRSRHPPHFQRSVNGGRK